MHVGGSVPGCIHDALRWTGIPFRVYSHHVPATGSGSTVTLKMNEWILQALIASDFIISITSHKDRNYSLQNTCNQSEHLCIDLKGESKIKPFYPIFFSPGENTARCTDKISVAELKKSSKSWTQKAQFYTFPAGLFYFHGILTIFYVQMFSIPEKQIHTFLRV